MAKQTSKKSTESTAVEAAPQERSPVAQQGVDNLTTAQQLAEVSREALASGASDVTRGEDSLRVGKRVSNLSEIVFAAGVDDVEQGAEMLTASDDIAVQSALVGALSAGDLRRGMEIAGVAGELRAAGDVVAILGMPVLSDFLVEKGDQLQELAVTSLLRFGATRALAESMADTSSQIRSLGENELFEGSVRLEASDVLHTTGRVLAKEGSKLVELGIDELNAASGMAETARDHVIEGVNQLIDAK